MCNYIVEATSLSKAYKGKEALHQCSIHIESNSVYSLVGPNGAGKTTLFKILLGFTQATNGSARILGEDCYVGNINIVRLTGNIIETPIFYEHLSAIENLHIHTEYMNASSKNGDMMEVKAVLDLVGLNSSGTQSVSEYSLGMRQRLAIARAIIHRPKLLILDEPINGLDPTGIVEMRELFKTLKESGITILVSSHILSEVEKMSDKIGVIVDGKIMCEKTIEEIRTEFTDGLESFFTKIVGGRISV